MFLKIHGFGLADLGSALNLNGMFVSIYGRMSAGGFPLATPSQARLPVKRQIFQAFGNWLGTEMSIDLILAVAAGTFIAGSLMRGAGRR